MGIINFVRWRVRLFLFMYLTLAFHVTKHIYYLKHSIQHVTVVWGSKTVKWSRYRPGVAQRVGRGIALLFHDRGTRRGWVVSSTSRSLFTPGKDPVPILQEAGWALGPMWRAENLVPTGIRSRTVQHVVSRYTELPDPLFEVGMTVYRGDYTWWRNRTAEVKFSTS